MLPHPSYYSRKSVLQFVYPYGANQVLTQRETSITVAVRYSGHPISEGVKTYLFYEAALT